MNNFNKALISVSIVAAIVLLVVGRSYAYFTENMEGVEETYNLITSEGKILVAYSGNNNVNFTNIDKTKEEQYVKTFSLTGTTNRDATLNYKLSLNIVNNTFKPNSLKYTIKGYSKEENQDLIEGLGILPGTGTINFGSGSFNNADGIVHIYYFKILNNDNSNDKGTFNAYIEANN